MTAGERIRECRMKNGMTQRELAERLGVAEITVRNYEKGRIDVSVKRLVEIAEVLKASANYLISGFTDNQTKELAREVQSIEINEKFFKSLGYSIEYARIDEKEFNIVINGVEYNEVQFKSLIDLMKSCVDQTNEIIRGIN